MSAILPILTAFKPGKPPPETRIWDHDHLAEAKTNVAIRQPFFNQLDAWLDEHEDEFWQLLNSAPQNVNAIFNFWYPSLHDMSLAIFGKEKSQDGQRSKLSERTKEAIQLKEELYIRKKNLSGDDTLRRAFNRVSRHVKKMVAQD